MNPRKDKRKPQKIILKLTIQKGRNLANKKRQKMFSRLWEKLEGKYMRPWKIVFFALLSNSLFVRELKLDSTICF